MEMVVFAINDYYFQFDELDNDRTIGFSEMIC